MCDYASLPLLVPVMDTILGYLSVKERVRCKGVCRSWRKAIERREQSSDTLILHLGPFLSNFRWTETNNRGLMRFEDSFQIKHLNFLKHPLSRALLKRTKKLAIVDFYTWLLTTESFTVQPYLDSLDRCEEIELLNMQVGDTLTLDLPNLKVLALKHTQIYKFTLNCPSLEVLFSNWQFDEIHFGSPKRLRRLLCSGWPAIVTMHTKFDALEYFNLFSSCGEPLNDRLLDLMPRLKRFVIYSKNLPADLENIRRQQKRFGLTELEVLPSGFREPVEIAVKGDEIGIVQINRCVDELFENYSKIAENSSWRVWIEYSKLFSKFKILPSDFFERFSEPYLVEITEVSNYLHLFGFLQYCPTINHLRIHFSKVKAERVLDLVHWLQPSLTHLSITEERPSDLLKIDFSFLRLLNLMELRLDSTHFPVELIRTVAARKGPNLRMLFFEEIFFKELYFGQVTTGHRLAVYFYPRGIVMMMDFSCQTSTTIFSSIEQLISYIQRDRHLSTFLLR